MSETKKKLTWPNAFVQLHLSNALSLHSAGEDVTFQCESVATNTLNLQRGMSYN